MAAHSFFLVGGPDTGKTNYLARLWEALRSGNGALVSPEAPSDIKYVEEALAHLLRGHFAPRSDKSFEEYNQSFSIPVALADNRHSEPVQVIVPDVSGELWKTAVETSEIPQRWMDELKAASGALLFVRIGSDQNVEPLDWVTSSKLLTLPALQELDDNESQKIPTQVLVCELLRFLEYGLSQEGSGVRPRVALLVTAWDRLDTERASAGPTAFIDVEYPLLAGRIKDIEKIEVKIFGVSVVGGDFVDEQFKEKFFQTDMKQAGYVVHEVGGKVRKEPDITLPLAWTVRGVNDGE